jgi:hypothetical protein
MITRLAWCEIRTREVVDDRIRQRLVLSITAAPGRRQESELHARAGFELSPVPHPLASAPAPRRTLREIGNTT